MSIETFKKNPKVVLGVVCYIGFVGVETLNYIQHGNFSVCGGHGYGGTFRCFDVDVATALPFVVIVIVLPVLLYILSLFKE